MNTRNNKSNISVINNDSLDLSCSNIPIECIRKTRSLNVDTSSCIISEVVYRILKSNNGRKIFT